ncbi:MAG: patatin-like phospholipase family protein [Acidobacteria bacterium]|nr:patatin-like phospholipase family protein [Acidobacteriota bacterium]
MQPYSPERRTALVLCGTGAHGAYHAGVLRALQEAGVKIDVMAGQGVGAGAAALAAIDGAARLWEPDGVWRSPRSPRGPRLYPWKWPLRVAAWLALVLAAACVAPLLFTPSARPVVIVWLPAAVAGTLVVVLLAGVAEARWRAPARRRVAGPSWWRIVGAPLDASSARALFLRTITQLIPGRRYADALADNLGQPGFRELMIVATDLDSRRDVLAVLLRDPYRRDVLAPRPDRERRSEVLDLTGIGRDQGLELLAAALTPPVVCDPHLVTFAPDSYWRGETHRLCDRPGAVSRLLEELAGAGVTQAIVVSAVPGPSSPHRLRALRLDPRQRLGEFLAAAEVAALRDAMEMARLRFDSVYLIRPTHNPVGPFDVAGAYDEASDRRQDLLEVMERAYEDAYRQFIEPVVGASGDQLAQVVPPDADIAAGPSASDTG